jgi:ElaB/YqjD/DUF883 family membrane-anchored ribosome-binding protein
MMNKSQELKTLTDNVEELLGKVADDQSPQLQELRGRVKEGIQTAKSAISRADAAAMDAFKSATTAAKNAASAADDYVRENPWVAVGVIAGVAASLGFLAGYLAAPQKSLLGAWRR